MISCCVVVMVTVTRLCMAMVNVFATKVSLHQPVTPVQLAIVVLDVLTVQWDTMAQTATFVQVPKPLPMALS